MVEFRGQQFLRYGVAMWAVVLAVALRLVLQPLLGEQAPLLLFTLAVIVGAWFGGLGPGLLATALSASIGSYLFLIPPTTAEAFDPRDRVRLVLFIIIGVLASLLSEARRRYEFRLWQANQRSTEILESITDNFYALDDEWRFTDINPQAETYFGRRREELLGQNIWQMMPQAAGSMFEQQYRRAVTEQVPVHFETRSEVTPAWVEVYAFPSSRGLSIYFRNVTERKRNEQERDQLLIREQEARQQAEAANRTKDEFLATVSHELRTPLTAILGWASMLRTTQFDETTMRRAFETIERNAQAQTRIIEDLLDVSRIISGKLCIESRPLEIEPLIEAALDVVRPAAAAKDIHIQTQIDAPTGVVSGDSNRLQQVIWNLLSNAIKFTPRAGRVDLRVEHDAGHQLALIVSDTGEGISREFLPFVFDRFRQADSTATRTHGGLGLGLAIVRHLVEAHGGTVHAASDGPGRGASFTVRLPLAAIRTGVRNGTSAEKRQ